MISSASYSPGEDYLIAGTGCNSYFLPRNSPITRMEWGPELVVRGTSPRTSKHPLKIHLLS